VNATPPLVAGRRVSREDGRDREASLRHWNNTLAR
jgi:hypothetical protein